MKAKAFFVQQGRNCPQIRSKGEKRYKDIYIYIYIEREREKEREREREERERNISVEKVDTKIIQENVRRKPSIL